jgi:hypothetical protein
MNNQPKTKLLTFESWVTKWEWYCYARDNPQHVPFLLLDRSPCQDPFFDPYAPSISERIPLISGLCRARKNFKKGEHFIYITRVDRRVANELGLRVRSGSSNYFGVAALTVQQILPTHADATALFSPRRYVVAPEITLYPPNIAAFRSKTEAAVARESCIVHHQGRAHTPYSSTASQWRALYHGYYSRQESRKLRVACCQVDTINGKETLQLIHDSAPVFTNEDWGNRRLNVNGIFIDE